MSSPLSLLLTHVVTVTILVVLGVVIRTKGPQGFVHGIVDWSKVDDATRRRGGRLMGNILLVMAAWIAGFAAFHYQGVYDQATNHLARLIFIGGISVLGLVMILVQLRLRNNR